MKKWARRHLTSIVERLIYEHTKSWRFQHTWSHTNPQFQAYRVLIEQIWDNNFEQMSHGLFWFSFEQVIESNFTNNWLESWRVPLFSFNNVWMLNHTVAKSCKLKSPIDFTSGIESCGPWFEIKIHITPIFWTLFSAPQSTPTSKAYWMVSVKLVWTALQLLHLVMHAVAPWFLIIWSRRLLLVSFILPDQ